MKNIYYRFHNTSRFLFLRSPEGAAEPLETTIDTARQDPRSLADQLVQRFPGADLTDVVNQLPGAEDLTPEIEAITARLQSETPFEDLANTMRAFGETDLGNNGANLFSMFQSLLEDLGVDLEGLEGSEGNNSGPSGSPNGGPDSGPMAEVPPNEEMPELDEEPSPEDMQMLRERSRNADVENMTNPAKNIAIETLRAHPGLTVTSGYRGPERNAAAGGAVGSDHLTGNAIDFGTVDPNIKRWVEEAFSGQVWADIHGSGGSGPANHLHVSYRPGGRRIT